MACHTLIASLKAIEKTLRDNKIQKPSSNVHHIQRTGTYEATDWAKINQDIVTFVKRRSI